jgi:hypothetical protein
MDKHFRAAARTFQDTGAPLTGFPLLPTELSQQGLRISFGGDGLPIHPVDLPTTDRLSPAALTQAVLQDGYTAL